MRIYKATDYNDMSRKAANIISAQIIMKPDCVLGLATGSSPVGTYKQLIEWYNKNDLDFSEVTSINLDEYKGLSPEDPQSYRYFMNTHLFDHVNIDKIVLSFQMDLQLTQKKLVQSTMQTLLNRVVLTYSFLESEETDILDFNDQVQIFKKETHCVDLTESTIEANKRFFASEADVPRQAYSLGIKNIMQARKILVIVSGKDKADALYNAVHGEITPAVPASILQLHNDVTIVADADALNNF